MTDVTEMTGKQIAGLPGPLPPGEVLLWQGAPNWWTLARRALHIHQVAAYFAVLLVWTWAFPALLNHDSLEAEA